MLPAIRTVIEIKYLGVYTCDGCHVVDVGTTARRSLNCETLEQAVAQLSRLDLRPHDMPYDWGSYCGPHGITIYRCPRCKE